MSQTKYIPMRQSSFLLLFVVLLGMACKQEYTPKPPGYFRIDFPKKEYRTLVSDCPFTFDYPIYCAIEKDTYPGAMPCWLNIEFPTYKATIHLSYKELHDDLRKMTEDSRTLAMKHAVKAEEIDENPFITPFKCYGLLYDIKGNAASPIQFYLTDSSKHFLRASLYFNVPPRADSLKPVLVFIQQDITRMLDSFHWK